MGSWFKILIKKTGNPVPEVIKLFSCSTQLRLKFTLFINVKINIYEQDKLLDVEY